MHVHVQVSLCPHSFYPQDSGELCKIIGLCNSALSSRPQSKKLSTPQQGICDVCKLVATFLESELKKNSTEAEAKQEMEQLCDVLGSLKEEVRVHVHVYNIIQ